MPTYFSDIILADIMTSFAKVIGDIWLSIRMFWPGGSLLVFPSQDGWQGMIVPFLMRSVHTTNLESMRKIYNTLQHPIPHSLQTVHH